MKHGEEMRPAHRLYTEIDIRGNHGLLWGTNISVKGCIRGGPNQGCGRMIVSDKASSSEVLGLALSVGQSANSQNTSFRK